MKKNSLNILGLTSPTKLATLTLVLALVLSGCGADPKGLAKQTYNLYQESIAATDNTLKLAGVMLKAEALGKKVNKLSESDRQIYVEELDGLGGVELGGLFGIEGLDGLFEDGGGSARGGGAQSASGSAQSGGSAKSDGGGSGNTGSGYISVANTSGRLTINGLSKYNGKWVYAALANVDEDDDLVLLATDSVTNNVMTCVKITNGSATLKVWKQTKVNDNSSRLDNYSGSDKGFGGGVMIVNKATITYAEAESGASLLSSGSTPNWMSGAEIIMNVGFANGRAACTPFTFDF